MIDGAGRNHFETLVMFMNYLLEIKASHKPNQHTTYKYHLWKFVDKNTSWDTNV